MGIELLSWIIKITNEPARRSSGLKSFIVEIPELRKNVHVTVDIRSLPCLWIIGHIRTATEGIVQRRHCCVDIGIQIGSCNFGLRHNPMVLYSLALQEHDSRKYCGPPLEGREGGGDGSQIIILPILEIIFLVSVS